MNVRDILNMLKWRGGYNFNEVEIWYVDRGAPNDISMVEGKDVERIGRSFLYAGNKAIPFHRIIRVEYQGIVFFDRFGNRKN